MSELVVAIAQADHNSTIGEACTRAQEGERCNEEMLLARIRMKETGEVIKVCGGGEGGA